jgi:deoxyribonuclease V
MENGERPDCGVCAAVDVHYLRTGGARAAAVLAKSRFRTATHAVPVVRGSSGRPLFVTAAGMLAADAADLVRHMTGQYRLPDALRRADTLARTGAHAATTTGRQPD